MSASDVAVLLWRVSSWSNSSSCIEVTNGATTVLVQLRRTVTVAGVRFAPTAWEGFINAIPTRPFRHYY